jgi:hypothetical protein
VPRAQDEESVLFVSRSRKYYGSTASVRFTRDGRARDCPRICHHVPPAPHLSLYSFNLSQCAEFDKQGKARFLGSFRGALPRSRQVPIALAVPDFRSCDSTIFTVIFFFLERLELAQGKESDEGRSETLAHGCRCQDPNDQIYPLSKEHVPIAPFVRFFLDSDRTSHTGAGGSIDPDDCFPLRNFSSCRLVPGQALPVRM